MDLTMIVTLSIKALAEKFEGRFTCLEENTEKYIALSVPIDKKIPRITKNGQEITKTISYRLKLINSPRFTGYQILLIILSKESIKLNANMDMIIKSVNMWD